MKQILKFVLLLNSLLCIHILADELIVTLDQGMIRATVEKSRNKTDFRAFRGIPYAKPPIGELRFQSPQKPDHWEGIRDSITDPIPCPQFAEATKTIVGQEDCLYLNVYTPSTASNLSMFPVMVFVPGGGFRLGDGWAHEATYFMDHNVILVTLNYRLGALGFLSTADSVIPGNYGMKDQVAALKWVKENIVVFGGNPELVTIFGQDSGGASVHFHLYSPLSTGLFQRAISQSGSAFSLMFLSKADAIRLKTLAFGIFIGCPVISTASLLECLRTVPVAELVMANNKFLIWNALPGTSFSVVREPAGVEDAFIHAVPFMGSPVNNVPWMTGINSAEGAYPVALFYANDLYADMKSLYLRAFPVMMYFVDWLDYFQNVHTVDAIKTFYLGTKGVSQRNYKECINMFTDILFFYPAFEGISRYNSLVYFYYYDHRNSFTFSDLYLKAAKSTVTSDLGVAHGDELISFFPFSTGKGEKFVSGEDLIVSNRMIERWINFARTGNPSINGTAWDPFVAREANYLHITKEKDEMKKGLLAERLAFWRETLQMHGLGGSSSNELQPTGIKIYILYIFILFYFLI